MLSPEILFLIIFFFIQFSFYRSMINLEEHLCLFILLCITYFLWRSMAKLQGKEGFADSNSYNSLKTKIQSKLANYCKLTDFAQGQMKTMHTAASKGPGSGLDTDAASFIQQMYRDVYACKDELADSRAPCQIVSGDFIPCTTYTNLPKWSGDEDSLAAALMNIPNDLPARISAESSYYITIIQKLQTGVDAAKNPPAAPPDSPSTPSTNASGKPWSMEGFQNAQCSAAAAQARRERLRREALNKEAGDCIIPSLDSEIARINALLDSDAINRALQACNGILAQMLQLQADIDEIKRRWGDDGPKKSYDQFKGGDRMQAFLFSLKQNF
jgi:hypothetical protein